MNPTPDFRKIIRIALKVKKKSIPQVATIARVSISTISNFIKGDSDITSEKLLSVCSALDIQVQAKIKTKKKKTDE